LRNKEFRESNGTTASAAVPQHHGNTTNLVAMPGVHHSSSAHGMMNNPSMTLNPNSIMQGVNGHHSSLGMHDTHPNIQNKQGNWAPG